MEGILVVVCTFIAKCGLIAGIMGIMTRCVNMFVRAWSGKEDIF